MLAVTDTKPGGDNQWHKIISTVTNHNYAERVGDFPPFSMKWKIDRQLIESFPGPLAIGLFVKLLNVVASFLSTVLHVPGDFANEMTIEPAN